MQKNLKFFFVHYLQKQFHPLNSHLLGKLHQHPRGTPSPKDAARVFIYPPLYFQCVGLCYPGEVRPLRHPPPNHAASVLVAPSFKCAVWMAIVYVGSLPIPDHSLRHFLPILKLASIVHSDCLEYPPEIETPHLLFQHIQTRHHACHCPVQHKKHKIRPQCSFHHGQHQC